MLSLAPTRNAATRDTLFIAGTRPRRSGNGFGVARYAEGESRFDPLRAYDPPERRNDHFGSGVALDPDRVVLTHFAMASQPPRPLYSVVVDDSSMRRTQLRPDVMPWGFPMLTGNARNGAVDALVATWLESDSQQNLDVMLGSSSDTGRTWAVAAVTPSAARRWTGVRS